MQNFFFISIFLVGMLFFSFVKGDNSFVVEQAMMPSIIEDIQSNKITCEEVVNAYLDRIKKYNFNTNQTAPINAFTEINPSVLEEARKLDKEFSKTRSLKGPLHCIPVVIKDNIDTFDMTTTTGTYALLGSQPTYDAFLVAKLRQSGAIIIGKTGMDEFAWGMVGISSRSGRVGNAHDPSKNPGGSSSGTAVAVSANFALVGIGTDNSGSIRIPAAFNGIFGLRPSLGLISQKGIFPMGNLDGVAGPMTRTVSDLAIVLDAIAHVDQEDQKTIHISREKTYTAYLNKNGLQSKRIGIVRQVGNVNTFKDMPLSVKRTIQYSLQKMQKLGGVIIEGIILPRFDSYREFNQAGEIQDVNTYLASFPATRKNFQDICQSDRTRTFGTPSECLHFMKKTYKKYGQQYQKALKIFKKNAAYVHETMERYHLDALLIPISTSGSATYDIYKVNTWQAPVSSNAGLPSIAIPIGYNPEDSLPIGIELVGKQFQEGTLIEIAYAYEQYTPLSTMPTMSYPNKTLQALSIPELNNLITSLGEETYEKVLKNRKEAKKIDALTSDIFRKIVKEQINTLITNRKK